MEIDRRTHNNITILDIHGDLDSSSELHICQRIEEGISAHQNILLNISDTDYIDSTGLSVLITSRKKLLAKGLEFFICCPQSYVKRIFKLTKLYDFLPVFDNEELALSAFKAALNPSA
ncbi:MAG: STAS domain-containing protein [Vulcanimicrobiota bacterium]